MSMRHDKLTARNGTVAQMTLLANKLAEKILRVVPGSHKARRAVKLLKLLRHQLRHAGG